MTPSLTQRRGLTRQEAAQVLNAAQEGRDDVGAGLIRRALRATGDVPPLRPARGMFTAADLCSRSRIDLSTGCWHWLGACAQDRVPRIWALDHARGEKRAMSGPKAVWNIAKGEAPRAGWFVYRRCGSTDCVNPAHHDQTWSKAQIGMHIRRSGWRKGTALEARRANIVLAQAAAGCIPTPAAIVLAIRAVPLRRDGGPTSKALAEQHGIALQTVSRIRRGMSHRHLLPVPEAA